MAGELKFKIGDRVKIIESEVGKLVLNSYIDGEEQLNVPIKKDDIFYIITTEHNNNYPNAYCICSITREQLDTVKDSDSFTYDFKWVEENQVKKAFENQEEAKSEIESLVKKIKNQGEIL